MPVQNDTRSSRTARDRVRIALYRLELSILPHVQHDQEVRRRLVRMEELRQGLLVTDQAMLERELRDAGF